MSEGERTSELAETSATSTTSGSDSESWTGLGRLRDGLFNKVGGSFSCVSSGPFVPSCELGFGEVSIFCWEGHLLFLASS